MAQKEMSDAEQAARAERRRVLDAIANSAMDAAMKDPDAWCNVLWTAAMHPQRPGVVNLAIMAYLAPGELLDSFQGWRQHGRQVRKGERGLVKIFTVVRRRREDDESDEPQDQRPAGFRTGTLFTHRQTEPIKDAEQTLQGPPLATPNADVATAVHALLAEVGERVEPQADARALLGILGQLFYRREHGSSAAVARTEGESAAHVAALMLGVPSDLAPLPPMAHTDDEKDPYANVRATLERVIFTGRKLAEHTKNRARPAR